MIFLYSSWPVFSYVTLYINLSLVDREGGSINLTNWFLYGEAFEKPTTRSTSSRKSGKKSQTDSAKTVSNAEDGRALD